MHFKFNLYFIVNVYCEYIKFFTREKYLLFEYSDQLKDRTFQQHDDISTTGCCVRAQ
jgi:hypothetical protein